MLVPDALHPVPEAPHLSVSAQPAAASVLQQAGWARDAAASTFLPAGCLGQIPPAAERFLSSIGLYVSVHRVEVMTCT